ncbi:MAG TPA: haloacid dehalogenase type II [Thermoanaerobaculia bacterium]|jgi:2-haloalkanoic acid dehalogenase type II
MLRLSDFDVLSFDCYGTLIDWETGILEALAPWLERQGAFRDPEAILEAFARHESAQEAESPSLRYPEVLARVHRRLAVEWGLESTPEDAAAFGASVPRWPAFPDSPEALRSLQRRYRLVILSNVDRASFRASEERLGVRFDDVFTAEDIGSYKPAPANFEYLLRELARRGVARQRILHTAQSLYHDHVPARRLGLATAWIDRRRDRQGGGATLPPGEAVEPDFTFSSLEEMARARDREAPGAA